MSDPTQSADTRHPRQTSANATIARVKLPAVEFALAGLFEHAPNARAELTPTVVDPVNHALLNIHTTECDHDMAETAIHADPNIATAERYGNHANGWVYRVTLDNHARALLQEIINEDGTLLIAQAHEAQWRFRLVTSDRATLSRIYETVRERDYNPECQKITSYEGQHISTTEMTDEQRKTLVEGFEAGYYNIPRDVTGKELATRLGISHQALSERLRRAYSGLIKSILLFDD